MTTPVVNPPEAEYDSADVVLLGAGVAGLVAARRLCAAGFDTVVLESRDRVGGRLASHTGDDGHRHDLGATWFWPGEEHVAALIAELDLATHDHFIEGDALYHDPAGGSKRLDGNPIDVPSGRFTHSAVSIAEALAGQLPDHVLRLESAVRAVTHAEGGPDPTFVVHHRGGTTRAAHVVVAMPPALAMERVAFTPQLPEQLAQLARATPVWMGAIAKVIARYPTAFWRAQGLAGAAISHVGPMRELHDMSGPGGDPAALFGFVPLAPGRPTPTPEDLRHQLADIFGPGAPEPIEIVVADWRADPDTSPAGVDRLGAYQTYGHELFQSPALSGRLHWASTETSPVHPGHIDGAIFAAERAARSVIETQQTTPLERTAP